MNRSADSWGPGLARRLADADRPSGIMKKAREKRAARKHTSERAQEGEQSEEEDDEICAPEQDASDDAAAEAANRALGYGK